VLWAYFDAPNLLQSLGSISVAEKDWTQLHTNAFKKRLWEPWLQADVILIEVSASFGRNDINATYNSCLYALA
jgi:hypothetical protein